MGWNIEEEQSTKKGMETSSKILLAIIACLFLIIILIIILIINTQQTLFSITVDGKPANISKSALLTQIDSISYINIEEFAKLVGYEYHEGEYKSSIIEKNKCYVQGKDETATFYLNDNKVCKLPFGKLTEDYQEYIIESTIKSIGGKMYAPIDAINLAFNVVVNEEGKSLKIYTLSGLVTTYDARVKEWGYTGIADQSFENKKALLYGYLIVKKEDGLYKIIDNQNKKEIVPNKYNSIKFEENIKEFFVTNSLGQVGIINLDGTAKIEPIYESISVLDKKSNLYLIQKDKKYGVVQSGNITIVYPEYDYIGLDSKNITANIESQYLIANTLIPVCKNNKWGAFDKKGNEVIKVEYDGFGCNTTTAEVNGSKKAVLPVLTIERCNGIVVKKAEKYGLLDVKGNELIPIAVTSIYEVEGVKNEDERYFMVYNDQEMNVIERLIAVGLIEKKQTNENSTNTTNNTVVEKNITNSIMNTSNVSSTNLNNNNL